MTVTITHLTLLADLRTKTRADEAKALAAALRRAS